MKYQSWKALHKATLAAFVNASNAMHAAGYDKSISDAEYGKLVAERERTFAEYAANRPKWI